MLIRSLGSDYVVWDKSASIRFKKPGKTALFANLQIAETELKEIKDAVAQSGETTRTFVIQWKDKDEVVHAELSVIATLQKKNFTSERKEKHSVRNLNLKEETND